MRGTAVDCRSSVGSQGGRCDRLLPFFVGKCVVGPGIRRRLLRLLPPRRSPLNCAVGPGVAPLRPSTFWSGRRRSCASLRIAPRPLLSLSGVRDTFLGISVYAIDTRDDDDDDDGGTASGMRSAVRKAFHLIVESARTGLRMSRSSMVDLVIIM